MTTSTSQTLHILALLRFRAATAGDLAIRSFQAYTYARDDALEPFRFEALCRIGSIAEFSSSLPETPARARDGKKGEMEMMDVTVQLMDEWIATSSEIEREVMELDVRMLSGTGRRMVEFLVEILTPHASIFDCLPSKSFCVGNVRKEEPSPKQVILDFFEDCRKLLSPIRAGLSVGEEDGADREVMGQVLGRLNMFIFAPAIHFFRWLLYYWRRHSTEIPKLPFEETVVEMYEPVYLRTAKGSDCRSRENDGGFGNERSDPRIEAFWRASRYPVRGVWGCKIVHALLRELLEQNVRIASERLFDSGVLMSSRLLQTPTNPVPPRHYHQVEMSKLGTKSSSQHLARKPRVTPTSKHLTHKPLSLNSATAAPKKSHMVAVTNTFTCPSCSTPNKFTMRKDLRRHVESIHTTKRFWCEVPGCNRHVEAGQRPFNRWDNLARHQRRVHKR